MNSTTPPPPSNMSRDKLANPSRVADSNLASPSAPPGRTNQLTDQQRSRLFACLCGARYIHGAINDDDECNEAIYEQTLTFMEPYWRQLEFDQHPSHITVCKIWKDFVRKGLVSGSKLKSKYGGKPIKLSKGNDDTSSRNEFSASFTKYSVWALVMVALVAVLVLKNIGASEPQNDTNGKNSKYQYEMKVKSHINEIKTNFPKSLTPKQLRAVRARLEMMKKEVSVLLLLGRSHDIECKTDKTFCIGRTIANVSQYPQFGYVDARDNRLDANDLVAELSVVLDERNDVMVIDSLEKLPGSDVMSLFQFIDRDEMNKVRKGLLLLILYTGSNLDEASFVNMREAEIVERLLVPRWSKYVKGDTLTSVISRISGTIVKVQ